MLVPDLDGALGLTAAPAAALADRRAGIGGDGVIRVVPADLADDPAVRAQAGSARWFMDYRNADGSLSEMCGNGTRVFAAYLRREGLETADEFAIATRAGVKHVRRRRRRVRGRPRAVAAHRPRDRRARRLRRPGAPRRRRRPVLGAARRPRQPAHRRGAAAEARPRQPRPDPGPAGAPRARARHQRRAGAPDGPGAHRDAGARARGRRDPVVRHRRLRRRHRHELLGRAASTPGPPGWSTCPGAGSPCGCCPTTASSWPGPAVLVADGTHRPRRAQRRQR